MIRIPVASVAPPPCTRSRVRRTRYSRRRGVSPWPDFFSPASVRTSERFGRPTPGTVASGARRGPRYVLHTTQKLSPGRLFTSARGSRDRLDMQFSIRGRTMQPQPFAPLTIVGPEKRHLRYTSACVSCESAAFPRKPWRFEATYMMCIDDDACGRRITERRIARDIAIAETNITAAGAPAIMPPLTARGRRLTLITDKLGNLGIARIAA